MSKKKKYRPSEAARIIGCSVQNVRIMIVNGTMKAVKKPDPFKKEGHIYEIELQEINRIKNVVQTVGFPRGQKRVKITKKRKEK